MWCFGPLQPQEGKLLCGPVQESLPTPCNHSWPPLDPVTHTHTLLRCSFLRSAQKVLKESMERHSKYLQHTDLAHSVIPKKGDHLLFQILGIKVQTDMPLVWTLDDSGPDIIGCCCYRTVK